MNFVVDVQLARRLIPLLQQAGHDAVHTLDLPQGNHTSDAEINEIATREQRVVITKDAGFVNSFLVFGKPYKLLVVSTGNITNADLLNLFRKYLPPIETALQPHRYVELTRTALLIHR